MHEPGGGKAAKSTSATESKPPTVQSKISHFTSAGFSGSGPGFVGRISAARQSQIDDALLQLLEGKVLPMSLVDNPRFRTFVSLFDPR